MTNVHHVVEVVVIGTKPRLIERNKGVIHEPSVCSLAGRGEKNVANPTRRDFLEHAKVMYQLLASFPFLPLRVPAILRGFPENQVGIFRGAGLFVCRLAGHDDIVLGATLVVVGGGTLLD